MGSGWRKTADTCGSADRGLRSDDRSVGGT